MTQPLGQTDRLALAIAHLAKTIDERAAQPPGKKPSWTRKLLDSGPQRCAKKLGEEGVETALAIASQDPNDISVESADLIYHLLVGLRSTGVTMDDVAQVLETRQGISGIDEKAARKD